MTDTTTVTVTPVKPETWEQEVWDKLEAAEQWAVSGLHQLGIIFTNDAWPVLRSTLALLFSQLGVAIFGAISANIADPALIPAAVGTALVLTASTTGAVDAKNALAAAEAAVQNDPTVKALLEPATTPAA